MERKVSKRRFFFALALGAGGMLAEPAAVAAGCANVSASSSAWTNRTFSVADKGVFTAEFDATPLGSVVDTGIGVTYGPHTDFPWLAANIRFNTNGYIQAYNATAYASSNMIAYVSNTTYHVRFVLDITHHRYSVYVTLPSGIEQTLATDYSFRSGQQALLLVNNWSLFADAGAMQVCNFLAASTTARPNSTWTNTAMPLQNNVFTTEWDASPTANGMDAVMAFSNGVQNSFLGTAAAIRFYTNGFIQALNGSGYGSTTAVPYTQNQLYHFRAVINVPAKIYSVYVTPPGGAQQTLATNYAFRSQTGVGALNNFATIVDAGTGVLRAGNEVASAGEDWFGTAMLYPTTPGGREWHANWTAPAHQWNWGFDPYDQEFEGRGNATYSVDGNGMMITAGDNVRMYVRDPAYDPNTYPAISYDPSKYVTWNNVEVTFYGRRISETSHVQAFGGLTAAAKIRHVPDEDLCGTRGYYGRFRNDGYIDFEKEIDHGNNTAQYPYQGVPIQNPNSPWASLPFNTWIGMKLIARDTNNGGVHLQLWRDLSDGQAGGSWQKLWEATDTGWGAGLIACPGANPVQVITGPNLSVFIRNDNVSEMDYKKWTIREIPPE